MLAEQLCNELQHLICEACAQRTAREQIGRTTAQRTAGASLRSMCPTVSAKNKLANNCTARKWDRIPGHVAKWETIPSQGHDTSTRETIPSHLRETSTWDTIPNHFHDTSMWETIPSQWQLEASCRAGYKWKSDRTTINAQPLTFELSCSGLF